MFARPVLVINAFALSCRARCPVDVLSAALWMCLPAPPWRAIVCCSSIAKFAFAASIGSLTLIHLVCMLVPMRTQIVPPTDSSYEVKGGKAFRDIEEIPAGSRGAFLLFACILCTLGSPFAASRASLHLSMSLWAWVAFERTSLLCGLFGSSR